MGNNLSAPNNLYFTLISNKDDAILILNDAEKEDFYLEECHDDKANSIARRNLTYSANSIPLREINYSLTFLDSIVSQLPIRLLSDLNEVKIIQLMPT